MNTAAILIAYTFTMTYEAARAKRKVEELVSSSRSGDRGNQDDRAEDGSGGEQHRQKQQGAAKKYRGKEAILPLAEPVAQHPDKPQERDTRNRDQI